MKLAQNQRLQIVTRGLIFRDDHLLITQWKGGYGFPIGGRVRHGEMLTQAVLREIYEETGSQAHLKKLAYFAEIFGIERDITWQEYGWYFWVEPEQDICPLGAILPNPDHEQLIIRWIPLKTLATFDLYPRFLREYLPQDYASGFRDNPRHIVERGEAFREIPSTEAGLASSEIWQVWR